MNREGNDLEEKERRSSLAGVKGLRSEAFVYNAFLMMPSFGNVLDDTRYNSKCLSYRRMMIKKGLKKNLKHNISI